MIRKLSELDMNNLMNKMAKKAWNGDDSELIIEREDGTPVLRLDGHVYEPHYEDFDATCAVYGYQDGDEILLFDKEDYSAGPYCHKVSQTGSMEQVMDYIKKNDCNVIAE